MANAKDKYMSRSDLVKDGRYSTEDINSLIAERTRTGDWIPDSNFPTREDLRQYRVGNFEVSKEVQNRREDSQEVNSKTQLTSSEAMLLTEEGADFSINALPSIHELCGGAPPETTVQPVAKNKARAKPKPKANAKGEGQDPDKPPTALEKAVLLKKSVFLVCISFSRFFFQPAFSQHFSQPTFHQRMHFCDLVHFCFTYFYSYIFFQQVYKIV